MSAIAGILYLDRQPVERNHLIKMSDVLAHRGVDGANVWCKDNIGLVHRMLWTTPESLLETLPLEKDNLTITADARIDNREELITALELYHLPAEKITDSDLILAAYQKWGKQCPQKLLGDFAFAIWDGQQQQLFCARDHFGIKPFYYYADEQVFIFATEIKALLTQPQVPRCLNQQKVAEFLYSIMEDKTSTSYKNIYRLPPAHTLTLHNEPQPSIKAYWSLNCTPELQLDSDQKYADAFREIFTEAVRCRLRSAFPVGSHLSGGLDSSSVTCVARTLTQASSSNLHTFSNIFDQVPECDEREYIKVVLKQQGLISHYIPADKFGPLSQWQEFFQYEDEAFIGPSHYLPWGLNRATKEAGVRVVLDGFDGDTTVSHGALYFRELATQGDWATFSNEAKKVSQHFNTSPAAILRAYGFTYLEELAKNFKFIKFAQTVSQIQKYFTVSSKYLWMQYGIKPLIPRFILKTWQLIKGGGQELSLLDSNFAKQIGIKQRIKAYNLSQNQPSTVQAEQWNSLTSGLLSFSLELINHSAAAFSIESRHPFMDKRLIEFCLALPAKQRLNQGWSRMILRRAMEGILPQPIQWRGGKTSMSPNFRRGLLDLDREILDQTLIKDVGKLKDFVNLKYLDSCYNKLISQTNLTDEERMAIWKAVTLSLWLRYTAITE